MFGYIKPYIPALTVAEYEAYRGAYCGLCRTMGSLTGQVSRLTLNYDLAFLAIYRMAAGRIASDFERKRCIVHPVMRRTHMKRNEALEYCAAVSAVLTAGKVRDNINDEHGVRRLAAKAASPITDSFVKRVNGMISCLASEVNGDLESLAEKEAASCASLDEPANCFADLLAKVTSFGYEGEIRTISEQIGHSLG